jgi:hypothetical protein
MAAKSPAARVAVRVYERGKLRLVEGYLVHTPKASWAYRTKKSIGSDPVRARALPIDPKLLEEQPQPSGKPRLFFYREILNVPETPRLPPSLLANLPSQPKKSRLN